jgi:hypothetical protein
VLRLNATLPTTYGVAEVLWLADLDADAVGLLAEVAEAPSLWRHMSHYILGDVFARLGMLVPAQNHLGWCLRASKDELLNSRWSAFSGPMLEDCREHYDNVSRAVAHLDAGTLSPRCNFCGARFKGPWVCVLCSADYRLAQERCFFVKLLL